MKYDDEKDTIVPNLPYDVISGTSSFVLKTGPPQIHPGNIYNIRVCAVNGAGPGKWSDDYIISF